jgi:dTDP-4-dehydrorhamnose reductase
MGDPVSVLVLGSSGMLGSTVVRRLHTRHADWRIEGASRGTSERFRFEADSGRPGLAHLFRTRRHDYIINCIGVLKQAIDERRSESVERAIRVNALFPHEVAEVAAQQLTRVIHVSTDAVFSGHRETPYTESVSPDPIDVYGMTKALGESQASNVINVRCSIVGRDTRQRGLIEWYLASTCDSLVGFSDYVWTPTTTIQFADLCETLIRREFDSARANGPVLHFAPNPPLSKADFLQHLRDSLGRGPFITARPGPDGPCHRILASTSQISLELSSADRGWLGLLPELLAEFSERSA